MSDAFLVSFRYILFETYRGFHKYLLVRGQVALFGGMLPLFVYLTHGHH